MMTPQHFSTKRPTLPASPNGRDSVFSLQDRWQRAHVARRWQRSLHDGWQRFHRVASRCKDSRSLAAPLAVPFRVPRRHHGTERWASPLSVVRSATLGATNHCHWACNATHARIETRPAGRPKPVGHVLIQCSRDGTKRQAIRAIRHPLAAYPAPRSTARRPTTSASTP